MLMDALRVKKQPLAVTLYMVDGKVESGTIFLAHQSARYSGQQTVQELMDSKDAWLPFKAGPDRFQLVGKHGIVAVRAVAGAKPPGFYERVFASIRTAGGHRLDGELLVEGGRGERMSDTLREDWLRLETQAGLVWVNRSHTLVVETRQ